MYVTDDLTYWGVARNQETGPLAEQAARRLCEEDRAETCLRNIVFYRAVVATAQSLERKYYFAKGVNRDVAQALAMDRCSRAGGRGCRVERGHVWRNDP